MIRNVRLEVSRNPLFPKAKFDGFTFPGHFTSASVLKALDLPNDRLHQMFLASYVVRRGYTKHRPMVKGERVWIWVAPPIPVVPAQEVDLDPVPPPAATPAGDPLLAGLEAAARAAVEHPEVEVRLVCKAALRTLDRIARRVSERKV